MKSVGSVGSIRSVEIVIGIFVFGTVLFAAGSLGHAQERFPAKPTLILNKSCTEAAPAKLAALKSGELRLASYNVENLFDAEHDSGKKDFEFLPASAPEKSGCAKVEEAYRDSCFKKDWNEAAFAKKVDLMVEAFKAQYKSESAYPDILVLTEVENPKALLKFAEALGYTTPRKKYPVQSNDYTELYAAGFVSCQDLGKGALMSNSPDERGIDVAVLYKKKLRVIACDEYLVNKKHPTRNILAATFETQDQKTFTVIANHWPSQGSPTAARAQAAKKLKELFASYGETQDVIALGDFNTIEKEDAGVPHPIDKTLLAGGKIVDVANASAYQIGVGTYYYGFKAQWNRLDRIFASRSLLKDTSDQSLSIDPDSYLTHAHKALTRENKLWFFRDEAAVKNYEKETGYPLKFYALAQDASDPRVMKSFKNAPDQGVLEVIEQCAPNRSTLYTDRNGEVKQFGYSDHFAISATLKL